VRLAGLRSGRSAPAASCQRIRSPMFQYRIGAPAVGLCRFVRDTTVSDAGSCRIMPLRSKTYEQPPSNLLAPAAIA
jgi:hypothetical protein